MPYNGQQLTLNNSYPGATGASAYTGVLATDQVDAVLRDVIAPTMRKFILEQNRILKIMPIRKGANWDMNGRRLLFNVMTFGNGSFGVTRENGTLPKAGRLNFIQGELGRRFAYMKMRLSGPLLATASSGAIADHLTEQQKDVVAGSKFQMFRQAWGDGTGVLCTVSRHPQYSAPVVTVDGGVGFTTTIDKPHYGHVRFVRRGAQVAWVKKTDLTASGICGYATVVDVDTKNGKMTLGDITQVIAGHVPGSNGAGGSEVHYFMMMDNGGMAIPWGDDFEGLDKMLNTSPDTYAGVSGVTYSQWNGQLYDATSGGLSVMLDPDVLDAAMADYNDATGEYPTVLALSPKLLNQYKRSLIQDVRYLPGQIKGGAKDANISYTGPEGEIPFFTDQAAWKNEVVALNTEHFGFAFQKEWDWLNRIHGNRSILSSPDNVDAYEATYAAYGNLVCQNRNRGMRITGLDVTL